MRVQVVHSGNAWILRRLAGYLIDNLPYVHGAPWSVGSQGYANVSHGCINLSPDNADWYFNTVHLGDPIVVQA